MDEEAAYPFEKERDEEKARLVGQAIALRRIALPDEVLSHAQQNYRVLDLACGPGIWTMDVAERFSHWQVYGLDKSHRMIDFARTQAQANAIQNAVFTEADALKTLKIGESDIGDGELDFIHARLIQSIVKTGSWPHFLAECRRVLKPGGILQIVDCEKTISNMPWHTKISALAARMGVINGVSFSPDGASLGLLPVLPHLLIQAGFIYKDEDTRAYFVNYSSGMPAHRDWCANVTAAMEQLPQIMAKLDESEEETRQLVEQAIPEMEEPDFCALTFFLSVVARKPAG